jgi:hypothetical protein
MHSCLNTFALAAELRSENHWHYTGYAHKVCTQTKPVFESRVEYTILHIGGFDSLPNVTQVQSLNRDIYFTTKTRVDFTFHQSQYSNRTSVWRLLNEFRDTGDIGYTGHRAKTKLT